MLKPCTEQSILCWLIWNTTFTEFWHRIKYPQVWVLSLISFFAETSTHSETPRLQNKLPTQPSAQTSSVMGRLAYVPLFLVSLSAVASTSVCMTRCYSPWRQILHFQLIFLALHLVKCPAHTGPLNIPPTEQVFPPTLSCLCATIPRVKVKKNASGFLFVFKTSFHHLNFGDL